MSLRDEILKAHPLTDYLENIGVRVKQSDGKMMVSCPLHDDKTPSMSVNSERILWKCFSCGNGGTVIDLHMRRTGLNVKDAMLDLAKTAGIAIDENPRKAATYDYRDAFGKTVMRVDRIEAGAKKKFRQYTVDEAGNERNGIDGVRRVLYRLDRWHGKEQIALAEGEKCVHALEEMDIDATTNPGGSGGWLDAYAESLKEKHVEIWPDNDEPGEKWLAAVVKSLRGKCKALKICRVPTEYNDVADMLDAKGQDECLSGIVKIQAAADWIERGVVLDLLSAEEATELYRRRVSQESENAVDLGRWLPGFRSCIRPLTPGDMMLVLADTGVGKTAILANIAYAMNLAPCIFFELELAAEAMTERFIARDTKTPTLDVERTVRSGSVIDTARWRHIYICPNSKMTVDDMETLINESELKIGRRPALILVDYVGLVQGGAGKRYERMSTIAEDMKRLARSTNTVVCVASQVRRDGDRVEVGLHDGKDSGSLENSAQLVIGAWRPQVNRMMLRVLKQTRRAGQFDIECIYDGDRQSIQELAIVEELP